MPLYDFICRKCLKEFELLVMGVTKPACPHCRSTELAKQMSAFSVGSTGRRTAQSAAGGDTASAGKCSGCAGTSCSTCH